MINKIDKKYYFLLNCAILFLSEMNVVNSVRGIAGSDDDLG